MKSRHNTIVLHFIGFTRHCRGKETLALKFISNSLRG